MVECRWCIYVVGRGEWGLYSLRGMIIFMLSGFLSCILWLSRVAVTSIEGSPIEFPDNTILAACLFDTDNHTIYQKILAFMSSFSQTISLRSYLVNNTRYRSG